MLCRATNALISVRLIYNNLRKKYRNFCFFYFVRLFIFDSFPPFNSTFFFFHQPFILPPVKHWSPWVYTTKEYRQNMLRWKRHNRSAYTNNSTVEVKVIGGLFIFFPLFTFASYPISLEMAHRRLRAICGCGYYFSQNFLSLEILHPRISICYQLFL